MMMSQLIVFIIDILELILPLKQLKIIFGAMSADPNNQQNQPISIHEDEVVEIENEDDHASEFSEDFHSDPDNIEDIQLDEQKKQGEGQLLQERAPVKNPVSPYMVFVKNWKTEHPNQKMNISLMGQIWNQLTDHEKSTYEQKHKEEKIKYEEYIAYMTAKDPNFKKGGNSQGNKLFFPMHRVRAIMKQDTYYTATTENVTSMTRAVEYFGEYLLEEVKKMSQGKKRIDSGQLFDCINGNQSQLWFLNCLIDQHNLQKDKQKKPVHESHKKKQKKIQNIEVQEQGQKEIPKKKQKKQAVPKPLPKGQLKLTDMF